MLKALSTLGRWVVWSIGRGDRVKIGEDPWIDVSRNIIFS
jgi:hypothetical protein